MRPVSRRTPSRTARCGGRLVGSGGRGEPASTEISARRPGSSGAWGRVLTLTPTPFVGPSTFAGNLGSGGMIGLEAAAPPSVDESGEASSEIVRGPGPGGAGLRRGTSGAGADGETNAAVGALRLGGTGGGAARATGRGDSTAAGALAFVGADSSSGAPQNLQKRLPATQLP